MNQEQIDHQKLLYNCDLYELRRTYRGYWNDVTHEGFIAIGSDDERMGGWEFWGEDFSESNLEKMFTKYPTASEIIFSTRLNGRDDENEHESGEALDHAIMTFKP
jgi:hypothetical protein